MSRNRRSRRSAPGWFPQMLVKATTREAGEIVLERVKGPGTRWPR